KKSIFVSPEIKRYKYYCKNRCLYRYCKSMFASILYKSMFRICVMVDDSSEKRKLLKPWVPFFFYTTTCHFLKSYQFSLNSSVKKCVNVEYIEESWNKSGILRNPEFGLTFSVQPPALLRLGIPSLEVLACRGNKRSRKRLNRSGDTVHDVDSEKWKFCTPAPGGMAGRSDRTNIFERIEGFLLLSLPISSFSITLSRFFITFITLTLHQYVSSLPHYLIAISRFYHLITIYIKVFYHLITRRQGGQCLCYQYYRLVSVSVILSSFCCCFSCCEPEEGFYIQKMNSKPHIAPFTLPQSAKQCTFRAGTEKFHPARLKTPKLHNIQKSLIRRSASHGRLNCNRIAYYGGYSSFRSLKQVEKALITRKLQEGMVRISAFNLNLVSGRSGSSALRGKSRIIPGDPPSEKPERKTGGGV
ncbi:unnamed protein product, partial [Nesidiocoris tenuis]